MSKRNERINWVGFTEEEVKLLAGFCLLIHAGKKADLELREDAKEIGIKLFGTLSRINGTPPVERDK